MMTFLFLETSDDMSATTTESDNEMKEETDGSSLGQLTSFCFLYLFNCS